MGGGCYRPGLAVQARLGDGKSSRAARTPGELRLPVPVPSRGGVLRGSRQWRMFSSTSQVASNPIASVGLDDDVEGNAKGIQA